MVRCLIGNHPADFPAFASTAELGQHIVADHVHRRFKWWERLIGRRCIHCTERRD